MLFSDLVNSVDGEHKISKDEEVTSIVSDTRTLQGKQGEVFVAFKGENRDGNDFIDEAYALGVRNFIVEKVPTGDSVNYLLAKNTISALQQIATNHRNQFDIPIIGITGSNGKTIVKEWLFELLSTDFFVVKSPKSFNSQIGVPLSVLELRSNHEIGIFEAGVSESGEMENLEKIIRPSIGIFTTLGAAHEKGFGSKEQKLEEKLKLFSNSDKIICRKDVGWFERVAEAIPNERLITWSLEGEANYSVQWNDAGILINSVNYTTDLNNPAALENITHCIITALELGVTPQDVQSRLNTIKSIPMRLELKRGINGCFVLDDTYNNDLIGLRVAVDHIITHKQNKKKTLILSDILQSGKPDNELYSEVADLIKRKGFSRIIGVGKNISSNKDTFNIDKTFFSSTEELLQNLPDFSQEMILVKGARDFQLERVVNRLEEKNHGTVLEVNFEALRHNLNQYRSLLKPETKMMVMVKANAYGSGIAEVSNFLQHEQVDMLGVAYVDEAIQLRQNGIQLPIMIMNPHISSFSQFERFDLQAEIFSIAHLKQLISDVQKSVNIHLKVDTGMHRLGFSKDEIPELLQLLQAHPMVKVKSIFTHFSSSDDSNEDAFSHDQAQLFDELFTEISNGLSYLPTKHACNSPAMVRFPQYHYDMVRLGIGLHGFDPTGSLELRPASTLKTVISQIQTLEKGEAVGYSRKGRVNRKSRIAILPLGYEDGYLRVFGNGNATVMINEHLCPTIGNICMDMTMVDLTDIEVSEGDEAVIFGDTPSINDLAKIASTIPYEILTNVSSRVKRVFISE